MFIFKSEDELRTEQLEKEILLLKRENEKLKHSHNLLKQLNPILEKATISDTLYQVLTRYITEVIYLVSNSKSVDVYVIKEYLEALFQNCNIEVFIGMEVYDRLYQNFHREGAIELDPSIAKLNFNISELYNIRTTEDINLEKILNEIPNQNGLTILSDVKIKSIGMEEYSMVAVYTLTELLGINPGFILFLDKSRNTFTPTEKEMVVVFMKLLQPVINSKIMTEQLIKEASTAIHSAMTDHLTQIPNRGRFNKDYLYNNENKDNVIAYLDLNKLKSINDNYGHDVADRVLIRLGEELNEFAVNLGGTAYRIGGDEFVIRLPDIHSKDKLEEEFEKLFEDFSQIEFKDNKGETFYSSISIGVVKEKRQPINQTAVFNYADILMYKSKRETGKVEYSWKQY